ncbi:MAG: DUF4350 domain-containing protein [Propionibacteriaceae bacterium]|jgi:hypothetical protein|nr:DUF4350 domain-containing protein [Propionibacteriaceae bacterium]
MQRWMWGLGAVVAGFVALVVFSAMLPESMVDKEGSIENAGDLGTRAVAQVLRNNGVEVSQVTSLNAALAAPAGSTLAIYLTDDLSSSALRKLADAPADLVLIFGAPEYGRLDDTIAALLGDTMIQQLAFHTHLTVDPGCTDPDAVAAGDIGTVYYGIYDASESSMQCYPDSDNVSIYTDLRTSAHRVTAISSPYMFTNSEILLDGQAALALRTLGRHARLTWYLPAADATQESLFEEEEEANHELDLLPGWFSYVCWMGAIAGIAAAAWQGRRFGKLVPEKLPVAVPAAEAATGLGRLYRQSGARGHAAAALRAWTLSQLAGKLGIPANANPQLVTQRAAAALRLDPARVQRIFYGPPPGTDAEFVALAAELRLLRRGT